MVQQDAALKDKVKFLAVGQGNDEMAMKMWKAVYKVPFALAADPKSTFGDALKFHPYPVTVLLDKTGKILIAHVGTFDSAEEVFKEIKKTVK
jgi:peroxiredoxin